MSERKKHDFSIAKCVHTIKTISHYCNIHYSFERFFFFNSYFGQMLERKKIFLVRNSIQCKNNLECTQNPSKVDERWQAKANNKLMLK